MSVARATYARSVNYTVIDRQETSLRSPSSREHDGEPMVRRQSVKELRRKASSSALRPRGIPVCARCNVEMRVAPSASRDLHYLTCPRCNARFASCYDEVLRVPCGVKHRSENRPNSRQEDRWHALRARAEAFNQKVEDTDPYRTLGLRSGSSFSEVRARYHELAARHHPDHGGDPTAMRLIIKAYEVIRASRGD